MDDRAPRLSLGTQVPETGSQVREADWAGEGLSMPGMPSATAPLVPSDTITGTGSERAGAPHQHIIRAPVRRQVMKIISALILTLLVWLVLGDDPDRRLALYGALILCAGALIVPVVSIVAGLPMIILAPEGLAVVTLMRRRIWAWESLGRFGVATVRLRLFPRRFAVAYAREASERLAHHGRKDIPHIPGADVCIPLSTFSLGGSYDTAQAFADEVNRWRDRHAPLSKEQAAQWQLEDPSALQTLSRRLMIRELAFWIVIALAVFIVFLAW